MQDDKLAYLKNKRDALNSEITLMEQGISKAAYDGSIRSQLLTINEARRERGEAPLTLTQFMAGSDD